jgi:hypothetical protein
MWKADKLVANGVVMHRNVPVVANSPLRKVVLIRDGPSRGKDLSLLDRPVSYQLVGKVMAYQGYDA